MNRRFAIALGVSVALNVGAGILIGLMLDRAAHSPATLRSAAGDTSVIVTLEAPPVEAPAISAPPAVQPEPPSAQPERPPVVAAPPAPLPPPPPESARVEPAPLPPLPEPAMALPPPPVSNVVLPPPPVPPPAPASATGPSTASVPSVRPPPAGPPRTAPADGYHRDEGVQSPESFDTEDLRPTYPMGARLHGEEGAVRMLVEMNRAGHAQNVSVEKSSGFASLDKAALAAIRKARFKAKSGVIRDGTRVRLSIRFTLTDEARRP